MYRQLVAATVPVVPNRKKTVIAPIRTNSPPAPAAQAAQAAQQADAASGSAAAPPNPRLIIDRDRATGAYAFTLVDAATGAVMSRVPVRTASDISGTAGYRPGAIARVSV